MAYAGGIGTVQKGDPAAAQSAFVQRLSGRNGVGRGRCGVGTRSAGECLGHCEPSAEMRSENTLVAS